MLRVDGCCCILFTGERCPDTVRKLLLDEIARVRAAGVDREVFTLCKNEKYGQLIENLENVEDSASQMADFAHQRPDGGAADLHAGRADRRGCGRCPAAHPVHRPHGYHGHLPDGTGGRLAEEDEEEAE